MKTKFKILHIEDHATDAELVAWQLKKKFDFEHLVVDTEEDYRSALDSFCPDVILCDHSLPSFNSLEALKIVQQKALPVPFILITSTVSEEFAVEVIKRGADDYILKDRLGRLPVAVRNALEKFRLEKERKDYLVQQEKSERKFRGIIEHGTDGIIVLTAEATPIYVSPSLNRILGYSEQEAMQLNLLEIVHPDDREKTAERIKTCVASPGTPLPRTESRAMHKDRSWRWMEATMTSMFYDEAINGIVLNFRDITERKEAEQMMKESEEKYRSFFENSMDGILLTVPDGKIIAANSAACAIFEMTEEQICEAGRTGIVDATDPRLAPLLEERRRTGKAKGEITFVRKNGSKFPAELTSAIFTDASGHERTSMIIRDVSARKQAEQKLISTSKELEKAWNDVSKIMDSSADVICTIDEDGYFMTVSSAAERIWGYKPNELSGTKYMDLVFSPDAKRTKQAAGQTMKGIQVTMFENRYVHKNGKIVPMLWSARWDDVDKVMYCVAKDATKKKQLEKAFESERQRFYDMFLYAPSSLGIFHGPEHVFEMANDQYLELTGRNDIIGKSVREVFPELENQGLFELLDYVYNTGKTVSFKERPIEVYKRGVKQLFYLNFMYQPYRNSENEIAGIFFFAIDVTEQVLSRKKIEESEKQFRQIVETAQEGIWMLDENNRTKFVNSKMCEILHYSEEEIIGRPTADFIEVNSIEQHSFSSGLQTHIDIYEEKLIRKDGKAIWVNLSINPVMDEEKRYCGALAMVTDVTERKRLQEKIVRQKVQQQKEITKATLQAQEKERNHLGGELHDNINQILTAIKLYLKHYLETPGASIAIIENCHNCLSNAIEEIRGLSQNLVTHRFDVYSLSEVVQSFLRKLSIGEMIELDLSDLDETALHENIKLTLFRIIQEQLNNVCKYAKASKVTITISSDDSRVHLLVNDNGVGFDKKQKCKGVGITNIYNRVESYNGTASIQSSPGKGCSLSVSIPLQQPLSTSEIFKLNDSNHHTDHR
ncbi:MAG TPA: PAS domain S-box protein [Chitinophagaceae bacterium]|nr:PAS domain S-box protein [Chitinophagaceae bacterium]